jgi:hypothetical protein
MPGRISLGWLGRRVTAKKLDLFFFGLFFTLNTVVLGVLYSK